MALKSLVQPKLAAQYLQRGLWTNETFFQVLERQAAAFPEREAFCDARGRITYRALKERIERCAEFLRRSGIGRGDVVTVQLPNRIDFPVVFFALELIGAVANKVNPDFRLRELEYILNFSGSRAYVFPTEFRGFDYEDMARTLKGKCKGVTHLLSDRELQADSPPIAAKHRVHMDPDAIFRMAFTSGTTGDPKCVLHSFNTTLYASRLVNADMRVTEKDVLLIYLPMGLNWGYLTLLQTVLAGARAVLLERFSAATALELIEKERVSYIATAPASIVAMLNDASLKTRDLSSLRVVITGGASAAVETIRSYQASVHGHLIELYGMLETGFHTYTRFEDDPEAVNGTIGRVAGEMELRLIDERGADVPQGEIGEIAARGPTVHLGYHDNPEANAQAFTEDGWFRTGDLGRYVDRKGNVQDHRAAQGDHQPRRQEILPARSGGNSLCAPEDPACRDGRPARCAPGRAQLPVRGAQGRRRAASCGDRRVPQRPGGGLQAARAPGALQRAAADRHGKDPPAHPARLGA